MCIYIYIYIYVCIYMNMGSLEQAAKQMEELHAQEVCSNGYVFIYIYYISYIYPCILYIIYI